MSGHGGHIDPSNKRVALVIAVLAAALAFSETLGKSAQTAALQLAIVLATANIITGVAFLLWDSLGLGVAGVVFILIGFLAPTSVHLF
jgi:hypothetical protein